MAAFGAVEAQDRKVGPVTAQHVEHRRPAGEDHDTAILERPLSVGAPWTYTPGFVGARYPAQAQPGKGGHGLCVLCGRPLVRKRKV